MQPTFVFSDLLLLERYRSTRVLVRQLLWLAVAPVIPSFLVRVIWMKWRMLSMLQCGMWLHVVMHARAEALDESFQPFQQEQVPVVLEAGLGSEVTAEVHQLDPQSED